MKETETNKTLDYEAALAGVEGDQELLAEVVELFLEDCPKQMAALREAIELNDGKSIERIAHSLKGEFGSLAATPAYEAALRLETLARQNDLALAREGCTKLESEIEKLTAVLSNFRRASH